MDIADSAHRHAVPVEDMLHAIRNQITEITEQRKPSFRMLIGPARDNSMLEIGVLDPTGDPVIIHAMPLRRNWRRHLRKE